MSSAYRMPATGEGWRHHKGGLYEIVAVATHTENGQPIVVYTPYGYIGDPRPHFARPLEVFLSSVERGSIKVPRFSYDRAP